MSTNSSALESLWFTKLAFHPEYLNLTETEVLHAGGHLPVIPDVDELSRVSLPSVTEKHRERLVKISLQKNNQCRPPLTVVELINSRLISQSHINIFLLLKINDP